MADNRCDICGIIELIPYRCKWCGGLFCGDHRLPEKHNCTGIKNTGTEFKYHQPGTYGIDLNDQVIAKPLEDYTPTHREPNLFTNYNPPTPVESPIAEDAESCHVCGRSRYVRKCSLCGKHYCEEHYPASKHDCTRVKGKFPEVHHVNPVRSNHRRQYNRLKRGIYSTVKWLLILVIVGLVAAGVGYMALEYINAPYHVEPLYHPSENIKYVYPNGSTCYIAEYRNATDPSFNELLAFLAADTTESKTYISGAYVCENFAIELHNNAERNNITAHIVDIELVGSEGHMITAFNTTDRGTVYIDDTGLTSDQKMKGAPAVDKIVYPEAGKAYLTSDLFPGSSGQWRDQSIGIISSITFVS